VADPPAGKALQAGSGGGGVQAGVRAGFLPGGPCIPRCRQGRQVYCSARQCSGRCRQARLQPNSHLPQCGQCEGGVSQPGRRQVLSGRWRTCGRVGTAGGGPVIGVWSWCGPRRPTKKSMVCAENSRVRHMLYRVYIPAENLYTHSILMASSISHSRCIWQ